MGDFSRSPQDELTRNLNEGYVGLYFEQGVPILDRDLNLLQDLITATAHSIVARYIGSGVPLGSKGFAIRAIPAENDFRILAGDPSPSVCLVGGIEVSIKDPQNYKQPGRPDLNPPKLTQPNPRIDTVYLDVSLETVDPDPSLGNDGDVGIQTSVRLRPVWTVGVAENLDELPEAKSGHKLFPLARLRRPRGVAEIRAEMITDLRQTCPTLGDVQRLLLRPAFKRTPGGQFTPLEGPVNQEVTLFGRNFDLGEVEVRFGDGPTVKPTSITPTSVKAIVPQGTTGSVKITITTAGGSAESDDRFDII
jgi:hypothetical protein